MASSGPDLFTPPPDPPEPRAYARRSDPDTSHDAARRVEANRLERVVLDGLAVLGGFGTIKEVAAAVGIDKWSISPRFHPLEVMGRIRKTSARRGRSVVWELLEPGEAHD